MPRMGTVSFRRAEGAGIVDAVRTAGRARFRPIILTSLTTFVGLLPLLMETSLHAQFLIPMAISLAFGVAFATFITLLIVPSIYLILNDLVTTLGGLRTAAEASEASESASPTSP